jgi:hypothetical protein
MKVHKSTFFENNEPRSIWPAVDAAKTELQSTESTTLKFTQSTLLPVVRLTWFYRAADPSHVIALCAGHSYLAGRGWRMGTGSLRVDAPPPCCCSCAGTATIPRMINAPMKESGLASARPLS